MARINQVSNQSIKQLIVQKTKKHVWVRDRQANPSVGVRKHTQMAGTEEMATISLENARLVQKNFQVLVIPISEFIGLPCGQAACDPPLRHRIIQCGEVVHSRSSLSTLESEKIMFVSFARLLRMRGTEFSV